MEKNDDIDGLHDFMKQQKERNEKMFGVESSLDQALWDCSVEEEYHDQLYNMIVTTMQMALKNKELKKKILELKLREIPEEE